MIPKAITNLFPSRQPYMTRPSYRREVVSSLTTSWIIGLLEGSVIGILARRVFHVSPLVFALIMASPTFGMITSMGWARMARGRRKIPFIVVLLSTVAVLSVSLALLPATEAGGSILS